MKKYILLLIVLVFFPIIVFASQESCKSLYQEHKTLINRYNEDYNSYLSLSETYDVYRDWYTYELKDSTLLDLLKFSRSDCEILTTDNKEDKTIATLSASETTVEPKEKFTLTVTAQDDNGLHSIWLYYGGDWHKRMLQGTSATETFTLYEKEEGEYIYMGYVYGRTSDGGVEGVWTEPKAIHVLVIDEEITGPDLKIQSISTYPNNLSTNDELSFRIKVQNIGDTKINKVNGGIWTSVYSQSMGKRYCDAIIQDISPKEIITVDCQTGHRFSGQNKFDFVVDYNNKVLEKNESNNEFYKTININTIIKDDDLTTASLKLDDQNPIAGKDFNIKITAQDDQGLQKVLLYNKGKWISSSCDQERECTKSFSVMESKVGAYNYYGYAYGYDSQGKRTGVKTSPYKLTVKVGRDSNCTDSDGGINYYKYGESWLGSDGISDCCKNNYTTNLGDITKNIGPGGGPCVDSGPYLYEAYCKDGIPSLIIKQCDCKNGVCQ